MKKIKNNTGATKIWLSQEVAAGAYYILEEHEYDEWLYDSVLETDINSGDAIFNDGTQDYTDPAEGLSIFRAVNATCIRDVNVNDSNKADKRIYRYNASLDEHEMVDEAQGLNWQGTWVSQNYIVDDAVEYLGSGYICKLNTVSSELPTNITYWDLLVQKGSDGAVGEMDACAIRRTTSYTPTASYVALTFDTTDLESDINVLEHDDTNTERINIKQTGRYLITYDIDADSTSSSHIETRCVKNGTTEILGSFDLLEMSNNNASASSSTTIITDLNVNDYITLEIKDTGASVGNIRINSILHIVRLTGKIGATGPAGSDGSDGATGSQGPKGLNWQGTWVSQNYVVDDAVEYLGSAYICILNTVSSENPSDATYWDLLAQKGDAGATGSNGSDGKTVLNGTVVPTTEGVDGDFYIRTDTDEIYGPKTGGSWGSPTSLVGPQGPAGDGVTSIDISFQDFVTNSTSYVIAVHFIFKGTTEMGTPTNIKGILDSVSGGNAKIYDVTNSQTICEKTGIIEASPAIVDLGTLSNLPAGEALFELQVKKVNSTMSAHGISINF